MKNKYEDAYLASEERFVPVDEICTVYSNDIKKYASVYDGKLYCSCCRKAPLAFVNAQSSFLRGYPNCKHMDGCLNAPEEMSPREVKRLLSDSYGEKVIRNQINRLVLLFTKREFTFDHDGGNAPALRNTDEKDGDKTVRWQTNKAVPRKQINAPFSTTDIEVEKLFYGEAHIKWEKCKDSDKMKLLIYGKDLKKLICKLYLSANVYRHICQEYLTEIEYDAFVVFFASLNKRKETDTWYQGSLIRSDFLSITRI